MTDEPALPESLEQFVAAAGWKFASTMPTIPHEYTVRGSKTAGIKPPPIAWHDWFAAQIAEHGYQDVFDGRTYTYLRHDGWKYWVIDNVINREPLPDEA